MQKNNKQKSVEEQKLQIKKQMAYWNLYALKNLNSLTQTINHHQFPQLHNEHDRNWRDLLFLNKFKPNGEQKEDTFLSQGLKYIDRSLISTLDRVSVYKSQQYELMVMKNQFWRRLYHLKPTSREKLECRKTVRYIVWKQRLTPYALGTLFAMGGNRMFGISTLPLKRQILSYIGLWVCSEIFVRFKRCDEIFYSIPVLPQKDLQKERIALLKECLIFDGRIKKYITKQDFFQAVFKNQIERMQNEKKEGKCQKELMEQEMRKQILERDLLKAAGFKVITQRDIII